MSPQPPLGPFCQSCSMPLSTPEDFGTDAQGFRVNDYCRHCYERGAFTDPGVTMNQMIDRCVTIMAQQGVMPEPKARALLVDVMPRFRRWREAAALQPVPAGGGRGFQAGDDEC